MKATRTDPGAEVIISGEVRAEETSCSDTWEWTRNQNTILHSLLYRAKIKGGGHMNPWPEVIAGQDNPRSGKGPQIPQALADLPPIPHTSFL